MERGSAQLLGFHFIVNFRRPYLATSLQDFWRRWHISLSTWLCDYLHPLGGNASARSTDCGNQKGAPRKGHAGCSVTDQQSHHYSDRIAARRGSRENSRQRLRALDELCRQRNVRFILLLAPTYSRFDRGPVIVRAARTVNVPAISATTPATFTRADFPDGFHASPAAAEKYTTAALEALRPVLKSTTRGRALTCRS